MKIGYLDCFSGVSGDMCLGALVGAGVPLDDLREALAGLPLHGYEIICEDVVRHGMAATKVDVVLHEHEHPHRGLSDCLEIIEAGHLPAQVAQDARAVFRNLAEAEAAVHDCTVDEVHFHEVGAVDAICDIVGACFGFHALGLDALYHSTIAVGGGTVKAAHGVLPVPAPATALLLQGLPSVGGPVDRELATPTGVAILRTLAEPVDTWPRMTAGKVSYGAGGADPDTHPNVLRLVIGEVEGAEGTEPDSVWVLEANLDDMTGEELGAAVQRLLEAGALDALTLPAQMKKGRPGVILQALCRPADREAVECAMFEHTSTLGVRRSMWQRSILARSSRKVETPWGPVRIKTARLGHRQVRCEPEYDDCLEISVREDIPLREVYRVARRAADETKD